MRTIARKIFAKNNLDAVIPSIAGFLIILIYARHSGIGISPDSVVYMSVARNIHAHGTLLDFNARPLVIFPFFYPAFLSAVMFITTLDPMQFAPVMNALLFAWVIYLSGWIMEKFLITSKWYKHFILSCIVISPCLLEIYSMLWSETLFILLLLFFIIALKNYFNTHTIKAMVPVAVITGIACVTRYAGVTFAGAFGLFLILEHKIDRKEKLRQLLLFGIISSLPLMINLIRNSFADGTATGMRETSLTSFHYNIFHYGDTLCDWLPLPNYFILSFYTGLIIIVVFCVLFLHNYHRVTLYHTFENILVTYFVIYSFFIILTATFSRYELINSRLLSPIFIPMLLGGSYLIPQFLKKYGLKKRIWINVISISVFILFQLNQYLEDYENYDGIKDAGIPGYTEDPWQKDSEIVNFLRKNSTMFKKGYNIYSNSDDALYFFTGLRCDMLPHLVFPREINDFYIERHCYLVWFNDTDNPELLSLQDVLTNKRMILLHQFSNGSIYITDDAAITGATKTLPAVQQIAKPVP
ncbi:MAG: hypothetical protein JST96_00610 [Bacteroidetes bacterium]|nr:hypothetical protein [Bacteroidota bacterium]